MSTPKLAIDPLWQILCPAWRNSNFATARHFARCPKKPVAQCLNSRQRRAFAGHAAPAHPEKTTHRAFGTSKHEANRSIQFNDDGTIATPRKLARRPADHPEDLARVTVQEVVMRLRSAALNGRYEEARRISEFLSKEKGVKPSLHVYNALIMSNTSHDQGAAWRVGELLEEMREEGLQPDVATCHAVLKVLSVHVDHLLRSAILTYMEQRWIQLSEDGAHDVAAGLLREGLLEQALERLDMMRSEGARVQNWLLDMFVYALCEGDEVDEAYRIMRSRWEVGELGLSRGVWQCLLEKAADARHHAAVSLVWNSQVKQTYLNASLGLCLDVLTTAAQAGDAVLATDVFDHLSKRGTAYQAIHYELLISTYLATNLPDLNRALSILTIMPLEKLEPSAAETRPLYFHLRDKPDLVSSALIVLRDLHNQNRIIPIAALNLLIECCVEQRNLSKAVKIYKLIHTFVPIEQGAKKSFANSETFNLLLRGCRRAEVPDAEQASFLVSEMLALKVKPTSLTYDRLVAVFVQAANHTFKSGTEDDRSKGVELLDWSFRHFNEMHSLGFFGRIGTVHMLAIQLARLEDERCWDVLQVAEDHGDGISGWTVQAAGLRKQCEEAWAESIVARDEAKRAEEDGGAVKADESVSAAM